MNEARQLYLNTYGAVDKMDHLIQNCDMKYRSWKYWHAAMIHAKAMAVVVAYDIYKELCETGTLIIAQRKPVDFHRFREKLAVQMLTYNPANRKYAGDEKFRAFTQINKARRPPRSNASVSSGGDSSYSTRSGVTTHHLDRASGRLCGFLDELLLHEKSVEALPGKTHLICVACGQICHQRCTLCPDQPALHFYRPKGKSNACFMHYHNTASFGKWKCDFRISGKKRKDWSYPDTSELSEHSRDMTRLHQSTTAAIAQASGDNGRAAAGASAFI